MRRLLLLASCLCAMTAVAGAPPSRVEINFRIQTGSMKLGEGRDVLEHDGKHYSVVSESTPTGIAALFINYIRRESQGAITPAGLKPERFEENGRKGGRRVAQFDWPAGKLTLVNGEMTETVSLPPDTMDQASLPYGFAFLPQAADTFDVHVTDGRRVTQYRYRMLGRETLKTPLGNIDALHFEKVRDPEDKRGFEFWLAVDRHYLPVKLRYVEKDGRAFDSDVTSINYQ